MGKNHHSATDASSLIYVKKIAVISGVVTAFAAALGGACSDPDPATSGAGGTGLSSSSASSMGGKGGEDLSVVAGSVTIGSSVSSSSSSSTGGPKCTISMPNGGASKFASAFGDAMPQAGQAVAFDKSGNILLAGSFNGSINLGGMNFTSAGLDDLFVAKFSAGGQLMWAKSFGDAKGQNAAGIGVDANGNVYVTGNFLGSINFGGGALQQAGTLFPDVFLAKLNAADGSHVWSKSFGDMNVQNVRGLSADTQGNIVIAGYFQNVVNFGGADLTSAGMFDIFVAKFNSGGTHQWSRRFGDAAGHQYARAVTLDATGNVYLAGDVESSIDFGGGSMTATAKPSALVAKLDSLGNATWVKLSNGEAGGYASGNSIAVGPNGEVAVGGYFQGLFDLGGTPVTNPGVDDAFVTVFSAAGAHTYTKTFGDNESQTATGVAIATNGDVIVSGNFSGSIDLDTGMPTTSAGGFDVFLARLDSKGCPAWLRAYPGPSAQLAQAMALDPTTGGLALTGSFNGAADFGTGMLTASGDDVFLLSVNP